MNFAGQDQEGTVQWNPKEYNDPDVDLIIEGIKVRNDNIQQLPYNFSGLFLDLGLIIRLKKKK